MGEHWPSKGVLKLVDCAAELTGHERPFDKLADEHPRIALAVGAVEAIGGTVLAFTAGFGLIAAAGLGAGFAGALTIARAENASSGVAPFQDTTVEV